MIMSDQNLDNYFACAYVRLFTISLQKKRLIYHTKGSKLMVYVQNVLIKKLKN